MHAALRQALREHHKWGSTGLLVCSVDILQAFDHLRHADVQAALRRMGWCPDARLAVAKDNNEVKARAFLPGVGWTDPFDWCLGGGYFGGEFGWFEQRETCRQRVH